MKKVIFMGTPDFAVPVLETLIASKYEVVLVVTQPDRPKGRKRELIPSPVKQVAKKNDIPVFQPHQLSKNFDTILSYKPDLIITVAYGQLLPSELLAVPKYGCINVHASLLPELRGGAPIHYAILQGKKETGISIMYMVEKLDAGDIISQEKVIIYDDDDVGTLHDKLSEVGARLLMNTLPPLFAKETVSKKQNDNQATYAPNIKRSQEKLDWEQDHITVYNHIRGMNPWPVAYTTYETQPLKIWWALPENKEYEGLPGEIVDVDSKSCVVLCGNKRGVRLQEIQLAGKRKMTVEQYLLGSPDGLQPGMILGE